MTRIDYAPQLLAMFQHTLSTGRLDLAQWYVLEQSLTRGDRPRRMQVVTLQLITEVSISLGCTSSRSTCFARWSSAA